MLLVRFLWVCCALSLAADLNVDYNQLFGTYQGLGALSGGGGTSRLLYDYPEPYRSTILDALFNPNQGASLQLLKVEIGGDAQSSEATEASHMHTKTDENYNRGYEWWLLEEAKKRNPAIMTYGLSWGAPGWIGDGNYWSDDNINYHIKWVQGLSTQHNISLDYMGIWNEEGYNRDWVVNLRNALDSAGFSKTKILAYDNSYAGICDDLNKDSTFKASVQALGGHYDATPASNCFNLGLPLWLSEGWDLSVVGDWNGATQLARDLSNSFINKGEVGFIIWTLIFSWYAILDFSKPDNTIGGQGHGLMYANEPWSGHYSIQPPLYVAAHYTQFTFVDNRCYYITPNGTGINGYLDSSKTSSIVALICDKKDITFVIETTQAKNQQNITLHLVNIPTGVNSVHVWRTTENSFFTQLSDINIVNNAFTILLDAGAIYSISTLTGQHAVPPPTTPIPTPFRLPLNYSDNFNSYKDQGTVKYLTDQGGSFNAAPRPGGSNGDMALHQVVTQLPIQWIWGPNPDPYTFMGDYTKFWSNYSVSSDVYVLASGTPTPPVDGYNVVTEICDLNNLKNSQVWTYTNQKRITLGSNSSSCVTAYGKDTNYPSNYNAATINCNTSDPASEWTYNTNTKTFVNTLANQCLDVEGQHTENNTNVFVYQCNSGKNQMWDIETDGTIRTELDGQCLTVNTGEKINSSLIYYAQICGRQSTQSRGAPPVAYCLALDVGSQQFILRANTKTIASGPLPSKVNYSEWHTLRLNFSGNTIESYLDDKLLNSITDTSYSYGMAALGSGWHEAYFDNFKIVAL